MKIAVCVKHVPVGQPRFDPSTGQLDRNGPGDLNGVDRNAIEEALRLKDASSAEVVLVSVGSEAAIESLRAGLALGADRAVLVNDPAAAGSDVLATSLVLARVLEREGSDLVLFGQQASDGGGALLWAAVAERLGLPFVSQASQLTVGDGGVRVVRETEVGDDTVEAPLPAVVAVSDAINEPRYASLKGKMAAKKKPLEVLRLGDVGIDPTAVGRTGSRTAVLGIGPPPTRAGSVTIEDDGAAAQKICDYLVEKELV